MENLKVLQEKEDALALAEITKLHKELNTLLDQENIQWKQRVKKHWLCEGDRYTKFNHVYVSQ